jgi:hypothetical protein
MIIFSIKWLKKGVFRTAVDTVGDSRAAVASGDGAAIDAVRDAADHATVRLNFDFTR